MRFRIIACFLLAGPACNEQSVGEGIGRPDADVTPPTPRLAVDLTGVFVAAADPATRFAQLDLAALPCSSHADCAETCGTAGTCDVTSVDLAGLRLCSRSDDCIDLDGQLTGPRTVCLGALDVLPTAGDLAVLDAQANVHAYFAWGGDPALIGSDIVSDAYRSELAAAGAFVGAPFPTVPDGVGFSRAGCFDASSITACANSGDVLGPADPGLCARGPSPVMLTEIAPDFGEGARGFVELYNNSTQPVELFGVRICDGRACTVLPRGMVIAGTSHLVIDTPLPTFDVAAEVTLVAPGPIDPADPQHMLSFVRYGAPTTTPVSAAAVTAGLWNNAADSARAPRLRGESLSEINKGGSSPSDWKPAEQSRGLDTPAGWTSCSEPESPAVASALVISAVQRAPATLVMTNAGTARLSLVGWTLVVNGAEQELGDGGLDPAAELSRTLSGAVGASGEAALLENDVPVQYVSWGDPGSSLLRTQAVAAGLWPLDTCSTPALGDDGVLRLTAGLPGQSPADYR